jgi:UDP-2-acetamido-3-amino-2,3-dideoxy-glucuronate N-acetyltransferase
MKPDQTLSTGSNVTKTNSNASAKLFSIAVIGSGYWGKNLVRNFHQLGVLKTICGKTR